MIQLFETSSIDSNCYIGPNDKPFTMPVIEGDHVFLRLQVPYYLVIANGGGLPINSNVKVSFSDDTGAVNLCNLGNPAGNKYLYTYSNDLSKRIGEYRFMIPLSFNGFDYKSLSFAASVGDEIVADEGGIITTWIYGVEPTPYPFIDFKTGYVCIRRPYLGLFNVKVNGSVVALNPMFTNDEIACLNVFCFRVKIEITFGAGIGTKSYFTKVFQKLPCNENSLFIECTYSDESIDCAGHYNVIGTSIYSNKHYLRIAADIDKIPSKILKTYNSKCFQYRSEVTKRVQMKSDPMPDWFQDACETLMLGTNFKVDGAPYQIENENIFENNDIPGSLFQNINLPLSQCKCENVFVC